jgi:hypothetical protein
MKLFERKDTQMANEKPENPKPKMLLAIEHLDAAHDHMVKAMNLLSSIIFDWQKAADFMARYRDSLVKTVEQSGGDVAETIESQIRDFIPKARQQEQEREDAAISS